MAPHDGPLKETTEMYLNLTLALIWAMAQDLGWFLPAEPFPAWVAFQLCTIFLTGWFVVKAAQAALRSLA